MIDIKFKNTRYNFLSYFTGPIFLLLGISYFVTEQVSHWVHYTYLFLGVSITLFLILDKRTDYLTIDDEKLVINKFWVRTVYFKDIVGYEIKEDQLEIYINK